MYGKLEVISTNPDSLVNSYSTHLAVSISSLLFNASNGRLRNYLSQPSMHAWLTHSKGNSAVVTAKLQVSEHTEDSDFGFEKFRFICKLVLQW